jgi:hypothetical protein
VTSFVRAAGASFTATGLAMRRAKFEMSMAE